MAFIDELKNTAQVDSADLRKKIEACLDDVAEAWSDIILESIKSNIKNKVASGDYKKISGENVIKESYSFDRFYVDIYSDYYKKIQSLIGYLEQAKAAKVDISDLCCCNKNTEYDRYEFNSSQKWTSFVFKTFTAAQIFCGVLTLGIFLLFCLFGGGDFRESRICRGKVKWDLLSVKTFNLLKKKIKKEGIVIEKCVLITGAYSDGGEFKLESIEGEVPVKTLGYMGFKYDVKGSVVGGHIKMHYSVKF